MGYSPLVSELSDIAQRLSQCRNRIQVLIINVGRGDLKADNALHLIVEEVNSLYEIGQDVDVVKQELETKEKGK